VDRSIKYLIGIREDVPFQVGKFFIPCNFGHENEGGTQIPIILGHPFLSIASIMIDVKNESHSLQVGEEKLEFSFYKPWLSPL